MEDGLKIDQNDDGTFTLEWDKEDPKWSFLNGMTSKEITAIIESAIKEDEKRHQSRRKH
jgi:hypothetical protein|tara:strand:+ start:190 stop:366 length:177 start_codon:yes stop_codon:yes gene_type:complete